MIFIYTLFLDITNSYCSQSIRHDEILLHHLIKDQAVFFRKLWKSRGCKRNVLWTWIRTVKIVMYGPWYLYPYAEDCPAIKDRNNMKCNRNQEMKINSLHHSSDCTWQSDHHMGSRFYQINIFSIKMNFQLIQFQFTIVTKSVSYDYGYNISTKKVIMAVLWMWTLTDREGPVYYGR